MANIDSKNSRVIDRSDENSSSSYVQQEGIEIAIHLF